ncbi:carbohydrate ABC transporter permease [Rhodococcoides fascians]|uniref:carbohydrate ABC transporter permease n=1 Tax=Rhodococcoides fascians TaxID=1828 RepID=UPI00050CCF78|nr:sugar ABC transporter permease [Rhodococcus fascians]
MPSTLHRSARRETVAGYLFLLPSLFGVVLFLLVPIAVVIWLAFQKWDLIGDPAFVGFDNVSTVLQDGRFAHSLLVTTVFVAVALPAQTVVGLFLGTLLARGDRGASLFRLILLLPWVCAPLALGVVWKWILAPTDGLLNTVIGHRIEWLAEPKLVLPVLIFVSVWTNVGYVSLFFAAGLGAIPHDIVEASRIDGANTWQQFRHIKLPLLRPTTFFVLVTGMISSFQIFDTAYALAPNGGPQRAADVVSGRIYYEAFSSFQFGNAAVMALVLFFVLAVFTVAQQRYFSRRTSYELS